MTVPRVQRLPNGLLTLTAYHGSVNGSAPSVACLLVAEPLRLKNLPLVHIGGRVSPNPPKDTDGRREESGRGGGGVREPQGK